MSTTVIVKARAWGATATLRPQGGEHESVDLAAHEDRTFHLEPGTTLEVSSPFTAPEGALEEANDEEANTSTVTDPPVTDAPSTEKPLSRFSKGAKDKSDDDFD